MTQQHRAAVLRIDDAAAYVGMSRRSFYRHVYPHVRKVRAGGMTRVPVTELDRWVDAAAR